MAYGSPPGFRSGRSEAGHGPGDEANAVPSAVSTASILLSVSGGLTVLGGLLLFGVASLGVVYTLLTVVYLALGACEVYLGSQLNQLLPWARTAAILLSAFSILLSLLLLSRGGASTAIGLLLPALVIFLLYRRDAVAAFPRSSMPLGL